MDIGAICGEMGCYTFGRSVSLYQEFPFIHTHSLPTPTPAETPHSSIWFWLTPTLSLNIQLKKSYHPFSHPETYCPLHLPTRRVYACALTTMSFHGCFAGLSPPLDHKDGKHNGLLIPTFQCLHMVHNKCLLKRNEATCEDLVAAIMPPSCHLAISFDI